MIEDVVEYVSNVLNYLILIYLFVGTVNTSCFSAEDMYISLFGVSVSVISQLVFILHKSYFKQTWKEVKQKIWAC